MKRIHSATASLAICGLIVTGCGNSPDNEGNKAENREVELVDSTPAAKGDIDQLDWGLFEEPNSLDPDKANGGDSDAVISNVCEGLFQMQPDLSVKPWLAEDVKQPNDRTFVFTIRPGVKFHSGSELTAADVVWSLKRHARPENGESDEFANITSIKKTGDMEVTLKLEQSDSQLEYRLAGGAGIIMDPDVVTAQGQDFGTAGSKDACSGPFSLSKWDAGSKLTLARYDDYWDDEGRAFSGSVNFTWGNEATVSNNVQAGTIDGVFLTEPTLVPTIENVEGTSLYYGESTGAEKLIPTERGNATDPAVRTALSLAMDRQGIVTAGLQGIGEPWKAPVGPGAWGYEEEAFKQAYESIDNAPDSPKQEDLERAKEMVEAAGAPTDPIVVASNGTQLRNVIANALVSAGEQIGIEVMIRNYSDAEYGELFSSPEARAEVDFVSDDWYLSKPEALGLFDNMLPDESSNYLNYSNDDYAKLYKEAAGTYNKAKRAEKVIELQKLAMDDMLWIPLVAAPTTLVLDTKLTGSPVSFVYRTYPWAARIGKAS